MKAFLMLVMFTSLSCAAQKQTFFVTSNSDTIKVGDQVKVGPGSMPDGGYKYVDAGLVTIGPGLVGQIMTVKSIIPRGNKKIGYSYYAKLNPGAGVVNYHAYIEYTL